MNGFQVFQVYSAVRAHFTSNYDYHKMNGKTRVTVSSYNKRNDKYYFEKFGRKYKDQHILPLFVSIFLQNPRIWVGDLNNTNHYSVFSNWKSRLKDLGHRLKEDIDNIKRYLERESLTLEGLISTKQLPELYKLYLTEKILPETVLLFEDYYKFSVENEMYDPIHSSTYKHLMKYKSLIRKVDWKIYHVLLSTIIK